MLQLDMMAYGKQTLPDHPYWRT